MRASYVLVNSFWIILISVSLKFATIEGKWLELYSKVFVSQFENYNQIYNAIFDYKSWTFVEENHIKGAYQKPTTASYSGIRSGG